MMGNQQSAVRGRSNSLSLFSCILDEASKYNSRANTEEEQLVDRVLHESLKLKRKCKQLQLQVSEYESQKNYAGIAYEKSLAEKDRVYEEFVKKLIADIENERKVYSQESALQINKEKDLSQKIKSIEKVLAEKTAADKCLEEGLKLEYETLKTKERDSLIAEREEWGRIIRALEETSQSQISLLSRADADLKLLQQSMRELLTSKTSVEKSARDVILENELLRMKLQIADGTHELMTCRLMTGADETAAHNGSPLRLTNGSTSSLAAIGSADMNIASSGPIAQPSPVVSDKHRRPSNPNSSKNGPLSSPALARGTSSPVYLRPVQ